MSKTERNMAFKVFVDANILLDLLLQRHGYASAKQVYEYIGQGRVRGFISPSIVHMVAYWLRKSHGTSTTKEMLIELTNHLEVLEVGHEITRSALKSEMNDIEDALQYQAALAYKMDLFITNDRHVKKVALSSLPVLDPDEFLKALPQ